MNETPRWNKIDIFYTPMTKEEIKELQTNLISLVPSEIRKSKELTKSDKILLGQLVYLFGMDKAKANGYVFRSNDDLENDTQLSSQTIRFSINRLIKYGAINRTAGSRAEGASVYTLNFDVNGGEITAKSPLKITPKNHPYLAKDEVEAMIEGLRAEFQQQINELQMRIAHLEGVKSDDATAKSPLKITPKQSEITPQIQITDIETTNPIVTSSNPDMGLPICANEPTYIEIGGSNPDGGGNNPKADEGDKAIFNKIEGGIDTPQPDEATPDDEQKTIDYLNELETTLRDSNTNLIHDEVIALAGELSTILDKWGQSSNVGNLTINRSANLINWFVNDLTALAVVRDIFASHLRKDNGNLSDIANTIVGVYQTITSQPHETAQIWAMTTSNVQTTTQSGETRQNANKGANPVSGVNPSNGDQTAQSGKTSPEPHQSLENAGVITYTSQSDERAQTRPDEAGEPMQAVECIKAELTVWGRCEFDIHDNEMAETTADNAVNNLTKLIGCIKTVAELNWCDYYIGRAFKNWGWVLGTRYEMYHTNITRQLTAKRNELAA